MFGEFVAAEGFQEVLSSAHAQHVKNLQAYEEGSDVGQQEGDHAAKTFTTLDQRIATESTAVRGGLGRSTTHTDTKL
ncbi:hypothetical protein MPRM_38740 [Mycobacterium parmense]|uniref:Uncharacterized protein n=1 Tax=Mycobacterium parmense TaxID=185642 RepID=A0A7I7Z0D0_9MYCO|nr:DUF2563 family protein [Mycobacterium parmense]MCV7349880.1 DUF2563 family protein [Mycobacterium parmense]ORW59999.1 hypothetical protein AWC20_09450 [Mycobacterium parmense]BBZ46593.1 hypothetical protein MPRM_38740 [Mycobacterium parmense]